MEYRLLNDGQGVILTRQPKTVDGDLRVTFRGAPDGAVALFASGDVKCFRTISDGACEVPRNLLGGAVSVSVICYDGTVRPRGWTCEGIFVTKLESGKLLVAPDDNNLPLEVVNLKIANHELREDLAELEEKFNKLSEKFTSMMEGYDLV